MITFAKAQELAHSFAKEQGEILPGIYYGMRRSKEFQNCFYFDFLIVGKDGKAPDDPPMIAGAPGFIIEKETGRIEVISFDKLHILNESEGL